MGGRASIVVMTPKRPCVYLYTHWNSDFLLKDLQNALKRVMKKNPNRWHDNVYLPRVIFNEMTRGLEDEIEGYGLASFMVDSEHLLIGVWPGNDDAAITLHHEDDNIEFKDPKAVVSLKDFLRMKLPEKAEPEWLIDWLSKREKRREKEKLKPAKKPAKGKKKAKAKA